MSSPWISGRISQRTAIIAVSAAAVAVPVIYYNWPKPAAERYKAAERPDEELHPLLADHTTFHSYTTSHAVYPRIRTFYHAHVHREKLPALAELPLLVVIHGAGGVLPQFAPLLGPLKNIAPCFGIELPGHGQSSFEPQNYDAYTIEAFAELWKVAITTLCEKHGHKNVVLIGHSMGCSIAALLTAASSPYKLTSVNVQGLVAMCPKSSAFTLQQAKTIRHLSSMPDAVMETIRWIDGIGYENSSSVKRFVGENASTSLKRQQYRWNKQFRTPVWKRVISGMLAVVDSNGATRGGIPGKEVWSEAKVPTLLIAGNSDTITRSQEMQTIASWIRPQEEKQSPRPETEILTTFDEKEPGTIETTNCSSTDPFVREVILPSPASHGILYHHATYRIVAGLIEKFLAEKIDPNLNFGLQLQQLTTSGKWDVKNLEKWKKVVPVSRAIHATSQNAEGLFRALKTMRANDDKHSPAVFLAQWKDKIYAVVDISHDSPVYDVKELEDGGVEYHKLPTVSKIPPTPSEVHDFIKLVDWILHERDAKGDRRAVGVHCHYGYNRTGFFIVSYLVLRSGFGLEAAIDEFARAKPPGIKHDHFLDELFVRYAAHTAVDSSHGATMAKERVKINRHASAVSEPDEHDLR